MIVATANVNQLMKGFPAIPFNHTARFLFENLSNTGRTKKQLLSFAIDGGISAFSIWAAYSLRLGLPYTDLNNIWHLLLLMPAITVLTFAALGIYRWVVRTSTGRELEQIVKGAIISSTVLLIVLYLFPSTSAPRSIFAIYGALLIILSISVRMVWAKLHNFGVERQGKPVAVYGAGSAGRQLVTLMRLSSEYCPQFYLDDSHSLIGSTIMGLHVYNPKRADLHQLLKKHAIEELVMAMPSVQGERYSRILIDLQIHNIPLKTVPSVTDIVSGKKCPDEVRELKLEDLLGRSPVEPDQGLMAKTTRGKRILVTGAGGSIGSELCRQLLELKPQSMILFDNSEAALYQIEQTLLERAEKKNLKTPIIPRLGSVADANRLEEVFSKYQPQTVYHAAAYKHVPMVEANPFEGMKTNLFGTKTLVETAEKFLTETFVFISTDKAVRPTNVMGASKRLSEIVINTHAELKNQKTRFCIVRFGNVLGSSGSVIPKFTDQIKKGGPVTVTHRDMTRYFMTISEAVSLVIQAGAMSQGGEVYLLDMGEPVKIWDLAKAMIKLKGKSVRLADNGNTLFADSIEIRETGIRPGEKLFEELLITLDNATPTAHPKIFKADESQRIDITLLNNQLDEIKQVIENSTSKVHLLTVLEGFNLGYNQLEANLNRHSGLR
ncbi:MAG: polysaccharide biosynthesis protein [Gammaproteobacteria bacterium]|nr:polysaccharide biosynthesis protein [Gammaproteobacteria bacterium]